MSRAAWMIAVVAMALGSLASGSTAVADEGPEEVSAPGLSLGDALELARDRAQEIQQGRLSLKASELALEEARRGRLPEVSIQGQYINNVSLPVLVLPDDSPFGGGVLETGVTHNMDVSAQASVPVYSPQLNRSIELSRIAQSLEETLLEKTEEQVELEVLRAYLGALMAAEGREVLQESRALLQENLRLVESLFEQEAAPEFDLLRMEVEVANLEPELLRADNEVRGAHNYLKLLVGIPIGQTIELEGDLESFYEDVPQLEVQRDFEDNAQLMELEGQSALVQQQIQVQRAEAWPTVGAFGNFSYQGQANDLKVWDYEWIDTLSVGVSVSIPLYSPGRSQRVEQARVEAMQVESQRDFVEESLHSEWDTLEGQLTQLEEALEAQQRTIAQAERGHQIAEISYEEGAASLMEVNDTEQALRDARLNYQQTLSDYLRALIEREELLGSRELITSWEQD